MLEAVLRLRRGLPLLAVGGAVALLATSAALAAVPEAPPANQTVEATSSSGAVVAYSEAVWDCTPDSGSTFALGTTTVSCTATDPDTGLPENATFTVTVQDTSAPALTLPAGPTVEATSPVGAAVGYSVGVADIADPNVALTCNPGSGATFPLGVTAVSCTATDAGGNTSAGTFTVTVQDTTAPALMLPSGSTVEATSSAGAAVGFSVSAADAVDTGVVPTCSHAAGSTFPLGSTAVSCTATDTRGNTSSGTFTVTVADTTAPVLTLPTVPTTEATSPAGAAVGYSVSAGDVVDTSVVPTCTPASGSTFSLGSTTVSCTATDDHGNARSGTFTITVADTRAPAINVPGSTVNSETEVPSGAIVTFVASAADLVNGPITPTCAPASGSLFPVGTRTVTCSAADASGNAATATFAVTVTLIDRTAPVVTVPGPITAEAQSPDGARVTFTASAADNLDGPISPLCSPSSGSTFRRGTTTVTCSVTDARGNAGKGTFTVTVADTKAPALVLPSSLTVEANSPLGSVVTYTASAVDVADGPLPPTSIRCTPASGNRFPLGRTQVQCRAADTSGNAATKDMTVSVIDSTAPVLTVPAPIALTAPASGLPATDPALARFLAGATAEDMVDSRPTLRHDAPAVFPLGQTTVTFVATDSFGNWQIGKSSVTLTAQPLAAPPPAAVDRIPPDNVSALRAERGNARVRLRWRRPPTPDFDRVEILRSENQVGATQTRVFRGPESTFLDRTLVNGTAYRYVVVSYDRAGNRSPGVAIVATPKATMLLKPLEGARISGAPTLAWTRARGATYYNLQLYRGAHKALSIWLEATSFKLKRQWTFAGRRERLRPGFYRWYVWPGIGDPALGNYGPMLGESTFTIVR